ncbi:MAG TPA: DJ-1/PfpI family protein [Gammaproteobacteria bacterium]|nr:DJ-1/PfpI family protein [Gammaproteobacteria bacterium]
MNINPNHKHFGLFIFPGMTLLDFAGPYDVFSQLSNVTIHTVAVGLDPIKVSGGLQIMPNITISNCPALDVITVPGGGGVNDLMNDKIVLNFLRNQAQTASYVTSVCTGSLVLGAAGLLKGYQATTHWLSLDLLRYFGAIPKPDRVVVDRDRITGGGITAGIDFALQVVAEIFGADEAKRIQLYLEYNPLPPFHAGHPSTAEPALVQSVQNQSATSIAQQEAIVKVAAQYFGK